MVVVISERAIDIADMPRPTKGARAGFEAPERAAEYVMHTGRMIIVCPPVVVVMCEAHDIAGTFGAVGIESWAASVAIVTGIAGIPDSSPDEEGNRCRGVDMRAQNEPVIDGVDREKRIADHGCHA
jgi:hypothetical protein